jgi:hypothetical protein
MTDLLTFQAAKLDKSQTDDTLSGIMYLSPEFDPSICKGATMGCKASCLINSGRMKMQSAIDARTYRTDLLVNNKLAFDSILIGEITKALHKAEKQGKTLALRLNGTSDVFFGHIYKMFPTVQFYEYTKLKKHATMLQTYANVHITFSRSEVTKVSTINSLIGKGVNVAVVFTSQVPKMYKGLPVIDGDKHDRRFEDETGRIIGLKLKGTKESKQHAITSGFSI